MIPGASSEEGACTFHEYLVKVNGRSDDGVFHECHESSMDNSWALYEKSMNRSCVNHSHMFDEISMRYPYHC